MISVLVLSESDLATQLVGSAPPSATKVGLGEDTGGTQMMRAIRLWGRPPKVTVCCWRHGNSPPSDGFSMTGDTPGN